MKATSFSNAMVAVVGAYAETLAEAHAHIETLERALRDSAAQPLHRVSRWEAAVIEAALALRGNPGSAVAIDRLLDAARKEQ